MNVCTLSIRKWSLSILIRWNNFDYFWNMLLYIEYTFFKFRRLVACQTAWSFIKVIPVCYSGKHFVKSIHDSQHFIWEKKQVPNFRTFCEFVIDVKLCKVPLDLLNSLHFGHLFMLLMSYADFFQVIIFLKILLETVSKCQTVWNKISISVVFRAT